MEHLIYRCKHCKKEYVYCTYGNGTEYGTEKGCTREYCSECATSIVKALNNIPVKFCPRKQLITDSKEFERINTIFDKCKIKYYNDTNIKISKMIHDVKYKLVEGCYIDKVEYHRCTNENNDVDIFVFMEYDLINNQFTGKKYFENNNPCESYFPISQLKLNDIFDTTKIKPLEPPTSKLFFTNFEWGESS